MAPLAMNNDCVDYEIVLSYQVVSTQITFIITPAFIMSAVFMVLAPNTMALGAVATGSMKA